MDEPEKLVRKFYLQNVNSYSRRIFSVGASLWRKLFFNAQGQCYQKINNIKEAEENRGNCSAEEKQ